MRRAVMEAAGVPRPTPMPTPSRPIPTSVQHWPFPNEQVMVGYAYILT